MVRAAWIATLILSVGVVRAQEPAPIVPPTLAPPPAVPAPVVLEAEPVEVSVPRSPWYGAMELFVGPVKIQSGTGPEARFGTVVSPEFQVGYQFESGRSMHVDFRFFTAEGSNAVPPGTMTSFRHRVVAQTVDFDFCFRNPDWSDSIPFFFLRSRWELGLRGVNAFVETNEDTNTYYNWNVGARRTDSFTGLGPHFDYRLAIPLKRFGLEFFTGLDLGLYWGRRHQRVEPLGPLVLDNTYGFVNERTPYDKVRGTDGTATQGQWRVGISWTGTLFDHPSRLTTGYVADTYWLHSYGGGGGFMGWAGRPSIQGSEIRLGGVFFQATMWW